MPRKLPPIDFADLYRRYQSGESNIALAAEYGIGHTTILRQFAKRGYRMRQPGRDHTHPGIDVLRSLYVDQQLTSEQIGPMLNVNPASVRTWLRRAGISRSISEAKRLWNDQIGADGRQRNTAAAHAAVLGVPRTIEDLSRRAIGKERTQAHTSDIERTLGAMLTERSVTFTFSKAVGPYNVDLAAAPVAVEVFGGGFHGSGRHRARFEKRSRYLFDAGWHLLIIWVDSQRHPLGIDAAEYVVAFLEHTRRDPATIREYRVIRGTGEEIVRGCANDDHIAFKPARESGGYMRCDHQAVTD